MDKILDVMEDIKQNITDNQYKIIMDSLMAINKLPLLSNNHKLNKIACLFNWLDTKLKITDYEDVCIKKTHLQKYVITNYFDNISDFEFIIGGEMPYIKINFIDSRFNEFVTIIVFD